MSRPPAKPFLRWQLPRLVLSERAEVALAETAHHFHRFMRATEQPAANAIRPPTCVIGGETAVAPADCLAAEDWRPGQLFGRQMRAQGLDGIVYRSVRYPVGQAAAVFWPDCLSCPSSKPSNSATAGTASG